MGARLTHTSKHYSESSPIKDAAVTLQAHAAPSVPSPDTPTVRLQPLGPLRRPPYQLTVKTQSIWLFWGRDRFGERRGRRRRREFGKARQPACWTEEDGSDAREEFDGSLNFYHACHSISGWKVTRCPLPFSLDRGAVDVESGVGRSSLVSDWKPPGLALQVARPADARQEEDVRR